MTFIFLLGRVLLGGYFIMSAYNHFRHTNMLAGYASSKGVPAARTGVLVSGAMMAIGGVGIVLNAWIEVSIIMLVIFLLAASFKIHNFWKVTDPQARLNDQINFTKNVALIGALCMLFALLGSWPF